MGMEQECDKETIEDERLLALHVQDGTNRWLGQLYSRYLPLVYGVSNICAIRTMRGMPSWIFSRS